MKTFRLLAAVVLLLSLLTGGAALAQTDETTDTTDSVAVDTTGSIEIVDVDLSSYASDGTVIMIAALKGLSAEIDLDQLTVTENGTPVPEIQTRIGEFPSTPAFVALAIDTSGSMAEEGRFEAAQAAAIQFVEQKEADDFVSIVSFDDDPRVVAEFTSNSDTLIEAINGLSPRGSTAMFDGIITASDLFNTPAALDARRYLIVLTDGAPENNVATVDEAITAVEREGIQVFGVAIQSGDVDTSDLQAVVVAGDGRYLEATSPDELTALYDQIQRELNRAIIIGFQSSVSDPSELEFGISYGSLSTSYVESVPGFATTTTFVPQETTSTQYVLAQVEPQVVAYDLPIPAATLALLATIGIGGAVFLFLFILMGTESDGAGRFSKRLAAYGRRGGGLAEEKRPLLERIPLLNRFTSAAEEQVRKRGLLGAVNSTLEQGNIPLSAGEAIAAGIGLSAVIGLVAGVLSLSPIVGLVVFLLAVLAVFAIINFIGSREKKKFEEQLPDTLTLLSTSLRAGYSLLQAVEAVAQEAPDPTAREFGRAIAEARLGRQVTESLDGITQRTQSKDFEWAVMAIDIQREVGGNLAEVLQTVADTMLARNRLRGEISALTAEGRISALVLGMLPIAIGLFLWTSNPDYLRPMFESTAGLVGIGVGAMSMLAGIFWLRKIVDIEV